MPQMQVQRWPLQRPLPAQELLQLFFHILLLSKSLSFGQEQVYSCLALATLHYQMAMSLLKL